MRCEHENEVAMGGCNEFPLLSNALKFLNDNYIKSKYNHTVSAAAAADLIFQQLLIIATKYSSLGIDAPTS